VSIVAGAFFDLALPLLALGIAFGSLAFACHDTGLRWWSDGFLAAAFLACSGYFALTGSRAGSAACAVAAALAAWRWRRNRRRRTGAPRAWGLKSRARVAALAARARDAAMPRPILRPVLGDAW
jgi:membrane protein implicated in regulation of membrane protease activity